jgi:hypothetical protein
LQDFLYSDVGEPKGLNLFLIVDVVQVLSFRLKGFLASIATNQFLSRPFGRKKSRDDTKQCDRSSKYCVSSGCTQNSSSPKERSKNFGRRLPLYLRHPTVLRELGQDEKAIPRTTGV